MAMAALVAMAKVADPYIREDVAICGRTLRNPSRSPSISIFTYDAYTFTSKA